MSLIALVGNPNVGKSTLFNGLTGLRQHTGNWPGKTVDLAVGQYMYKGKSYELVDLPGTYSLSGISEEETITADFVREGNPDGILVVCDATCLERSLILALEVMARFPKVLIAVNLMDEAESVGLSLDLLALSAELGVSVIGLCGKKKESLLLLQEKLRLLSEGYLPRAPSVNPEHRGIIRRAEEISHRVCRRDRETPTITEKLDGIFLHSFWAYPCLVLLLLLVLWLTVKGANYPSAALQWGFGAVKKLLLRLMGIFPPGLTAFLIDGIYEPVSRVVSVMLPPMAIFFPLFTLLEDFGYLPRVAFLLDEGFRRCGACGKQALTMTMGFGCNAVGVTGCRIMDSPKERRLAILTNALVPCNGRFPALILLMGLILGDGSPMVQAVVLAALIGVSVGATMAVTRLLHKGLLKGEPSVFVMEMPPYRVPNIGQVLVRSFVDRCLSILGRAVAVAAPMGIFLWILQRVPVADGNLLLWLGTGLETPGAILGMGGTMLLAFLLGSPANELVIPIALMITTGYGWGGDITGEGLRQLGLSAGQCVCTMIFMLFHWPCTTTLWTVYKETKRASYTLLAWLLPTGVGVVLCACVNFLFHLF